MATIRDNRRPERGLRPVQDIVGRIRFDPIFDPAHFTIGYEERFAGVREAPLADFLGEGEVPWHRIWFIKAGPLIVWDRRERVDLVFGSGTSQAADLAAIQRACAAAPAPAPAPARPPRGAAEFVAIPCLRFDPTTAAWCPVDPPHAELALESLAVLTYNVLYDLHEAEHIYSDERRLACRALLHAQDADIIALQEVTPEFWAELLAEPWVQARYHVSAGPDAPGLQPYGQALLSRWPLALELHNFSAQKKLLLGQLALAGRPLTIAAIHLTSNQKDGAADKRAEQLAVLVARLARRPGDALVLGDLNFGDGDENHQLAAAGLVDAWQQLHPHHPGFTFDPVANPLAARMSRSGQAARFDRVLLRAPTGAIAPIEVVRFADRPIGERHGESQFASDHFGLCALLQLGPSAAVSIAAAPPAAWIDAAPVHRSALVVIPPEAVWAPIQAIRAAHDPAYARWMPHINLIYGFIPEARFPEAVALVAPLLRAHPPIRLRLGELRRFDHRGSTTVWLAPDPPAALVALQQALAPLFPACTEQAERASFTPHLTVAKLSGSEAEIAATVAQWQARWRPLGCTLDALHLISRRDEQPFAIRHSLPLGTVHPPGTVHRAEASGDRPTSTADRPRTASDPGPPPSPLAAIPGVVAPPPWAELPSPRHLAAVAAIAAACRELLGDACLHIVGSARLGVASPDSDLDLVCAGPSTLDRVGLFTSLRARLGERVTAVREATSAGLPVLRMRLGELAVDLQYAGLPASLSAARLAALTPDELATLDDPSRRAALTCLDADAVPAFVDGRLEVPVFLATLRRVRAWARARALDVGAWGLLGGYSWALLAGFAARDAAKLGVPADPDALLRHFFAVFAVWEPGRPVALGPLPAIAPTRRAPWPIYTPTPPPFNSARGLTRSTYALVRHELRRADAIVRASSEDLCAPVDPTTDPRRLVLSLSGVDPHGELASRGWLDGHVLRLLLALEACSARVRPYPRAIDDAHGRHQSIGLIGGPARELLAAAHDFCLDFAMWPERPAGATLHAELITT